MNKNLFFAEVIDSNLSNWTGQCWNWNKTPQFGSLVTTKYNGITIFGLVQTITTGTFDPVRVPMPLEQTEEELLRNHPQVFEHLKTRFTCIAIGYEEGSTRYYHTPSYPAKIHGMIELASDATVQNFFEEEQFLHMMWNTSASTFQTDEIVLAIIKQLHNKKIISPHLLNKWIDTITLLSKGDIQRIKILLSRIQTIINVK